MYYYKIASGENELEEEFLVIAHRKSFSRQQFRAMCDSILLSNVVLGIHEMVNFLCREHGFKKIKYSDSHVYNISNPDPDDVADSVVEAPDRTEGYDFRRYNISVPIVNESGADRMRGIFAITVERPIDLHLNAGYERQLGEFETLNLHNAICQTLKSALKSDADSLCPVYSSDQEPYKLSDYSFSNTIVATDILTNPTQDDFDRAYDFLFEYVHHKLSVLMGNVPEDGGGSGDS